MLRRCVEAARHDGGALARRDELRREVLRERLHAPGVRAVLCGEDGVVVGGHGYAPRRGREADGALALVGMPHGVADRGARDLKASSPFSDDRVSL